MKIELKKLTDTAITPIYQSPGAAGFDLHADIKRTMILKPEQHIIIPTGIAVHIRNPEYMGALYTRSGNGFKKGIVLRNGTGIIDSDFTKQIMVCLFNTGFEEFHIDPGDRIAQMVITRLQQIEWDNVDEFSNPTNRGGFGSTGK